MRFASTSEILDYVRDHPGCTTAEIIEALYPKAKTLPSDRTAAQYNVSTKVGGLYRRTWIVNLNPGKGKTASWRAIA